MIAVANFIGLPLLFLSSDPDRARADAGLDARASLAQSGASGA